MPAGVDYVANKCQPEKTGIKAEILVGSAILRILILDPMSLEF